MESALSPEQDAFTQIEAATNEGPAALKWALPEGTVGDLSTSSIISLLERGLNCIRQENYTEGVIFFAQARQQLLPELMQLAAMLATLIQDCEKHWQAQQALNQA